MSKPNTPKCNECQIDLTNKSFGKVRVGNKEIELCSDCYWKYQQEQQQEQGTKRNCKNCGGIRNESDFQNAHYGDYGEYITSGRYKGRKALDGCGVWCLKCVEKKIDQQEKERKEKAKCSKCQQTQLYDNSGGQFSWYMNEKHGNVCESCLGELDKSGELWDNFFIVRTYKYVPGQSDPGMESGSICDFCNTAMCGRQHHQKISGKLTLKHNCQVKCLGSGFFMSGCDKPKNDKGTFQLTQDWLDYLVKYKYSKGNLRCPDCEIEAIKRDINLTSNDQEISKLKEKMKEVEKITGKRNNNNPERERETNPTITNSDCWIRGYN